jgi:hypothetical protein
MNRHRAEVNRGFDAVSQMIHAQEERYQEALRLQRRWNFGLLIGIIATVILAVVLYFRVKP